jgi:beta-xylosidase
VQTFFPGEEGGPAIAGVLSGRVNPSGRLPVSVPRTAGTQPSTYYSPPLGLRTEVSNIDPTPLWPFGHGLSYTEFRWTDVHVAGAPLDGRPAEVATDGEVEISVCVTNVGQRAGAEVVQLYINDPVASVTRPDMRLAGYARVEVEPGRQATVSFRVPADLSSFTGRAGRRIVEPGDLELRLSASSSDVRHVVPIRLVGAQRVVDSTRRLMPEISFPR